jgi:queuine/archaeosine tRNA-ribosyltransferase
MASHARDDVNLDEGCDCPTCGCSSWSTRRQGLDVDELAKWYLVTCTPIANFGGVALNPAGAGFP